VADRRPLNPRLVRALREAAVPPLDYITDDTKVVEVPYPAPHQPQQPPVEAQPQQQQAPAAPKSRFDVVREYLERTGGGSASPPAGVLPDEVDLRAAEEADALASTRAGLQAAAAAFLGDRKAAFQDTASTRNVDRARALQAQRSKALADWVASQEQRRLDEARVLSGAMVEPSRKDPELEKRRLDEQQAERERREKQAEEEQRLKRDKFEAEERRRKAGAGAAGKKAEEKRKAEEEKAARRAAEGLPFGYRLKKGANPSKKQREDAASAIEMRDSSLPVIDRLEALVQGGPSRLLDPRARAEVQQFAEQLGTAIRTMENLGVPSGPDVQIGLRLIGDPTSPVNEVADVMPRLLSNLRDYFTRKADTRLNTFGVEKDQLDAPTGKVPTDSDDDVMMVGPDGEELPVAPAKVELFRKRGFKER